MTFAKGGGTIAKDKALTGAAGAYYVAFQLSVQGYAVGLTNYGTRAIDLVVANPETGKSVTIQTKTMLKDASVHSKKWGHYWKWRVGTSHRPAQKTFFYAFVDLKGDPTKTPDIFIVPSIQLTKLVGKWTDSSGLVTDAWCNIEDKDTPKYQNRWDIIQEALA